jgi:hypothetical protein
VECKHSYGDHDSVSRKCSKEKCKGCKGFHSTFSCGCGKQWNEHVTVVETRDERLAAGRTVDNLLGGGEGFAAMGGVTDFSSLIHAGDINQAPLMSDMPREGGMMPQISAGNSHSEAPPQPHRPPKMLRDQPKYLTKYGSDNFGMMSDGTFSVLSGKMSEGDEFAALGAAFDRKYNNKGSSRPRDPPPPRKARTIAPSSSNNNNRSNNHEAAEATVHQPPVPPPRSSADSGQLMSVPLAVTDPDIDNDIIPLKPVCPQHRRHRSSSVNSSPSVTNPLSGALMESQLPQPAVRRRALSLDNNTQPAPLIPEPPPSSDKATENSYSTLYTLRRSKTNIPTASRSNHASDDLLRVMHNTATSPTKTSTTATNVSMELEDEYAAAKPVHNGRERNEHLLLLKRKHHMRHRDEEGILGDENKQRSPNMPFIDDAKVTQSSNNLRLLKNAPPRTSGDVKGDSLDNQVNQMERALRDLKGIGSRVRKSASFEGGSMVSGNANGNGYGNGGSYYRTQINPNSIINMT